MTDLNDEKFEEKARQLLDESVDRLDGATLSKLHQARNLALAAKQPGFSWLSFSTAGWSGAGAVAASFAIVALYVNQQQLDQAPVDQQVEVTQAPLPVIYEDPAQQRVAEELELMDNLDFVAWLVLEEGETENADNRS